MRLIIIVCSICRYAVLCLLELFPIVVPPHLRWTSCFLIWPTMLSGFLSCFPIEQIPRFRIVGQDLHALAVDMDVRKLIAVGLCLARVEINMNGRAIEEEGVN
ncbi:hypothetical protein EV426DRAFT_620700 [Tirmania nivea]|nr:hypothetical protein EV426DRAFT_620700 [Tirmania nivea]